MTQPSPKPKKTSGQLIAEAAWLGLQQRIPGIPLAPMYCLSFVRRCIEFALKLPDRGFYNLVVGEDGNPSAAELEILLRRQRPAWVKPFKEARAGDTVWWSHDPPGWGHVGILVVHKKEFWVAQNTTITGLGIDYPGALRLVRLADMSRPTSLIRIGG